MEGRSERGGGEGYRSDRESEWREGVREEGGGGLQE